MQHFSRNVPGPAVLLGEFVLLFVVAPEDPGEGHLGAQDSEGEGEEAISEVMVPGGVDDEPGRDGDGGEYAEKGESEHDPEPGMVPDTRGVSRRGYFVARVRHPGAQSPFLAGSVEVFSGVVLLESEEPFVLDSPLVAAAFFLVALGAWALGVRHYQSTGS